MTRTSENRFVASLSTRETVRDAVQEVQRSLDAVGHTAWDLLVVFASHHFASSWQELITALGDVAQCRHLVGCAGESIAGVGREIEEGPVVSVLAASLPDTRLTPMHLEFQRTPEGGVVVGWPDELVGDWPPNASLLLLGEPYTFPTDYLLERINDDHPDVAVVGGMASGASRPGANRLFLDSQVLTQGAVGLLFDGGVRIETVVSQGCRPIGEPFVVTQAERNLILQLGGIPALEQLQALFRRLPTHEQQLVQTGLHLGRTVSEYKDDREAGDFLIRNVLGIDQETQGIAVADFMRVGQTVQFQIRDERTAHEDLELRLNRFAQTNRARAGLLFSCNGRGTRLFSQPHHDAQLIQQLAGELPLAGFFAQGEIGPVDGQNFVHGYTASVAFFCDDE